MTPVCDPCMLKFIKKAIKTVKPYEARDIALAWEMGSKTIRMSLNESPIPPSPKVKAALIKVAKRLNIYAPREELEAAIAKYTDRNPEEIAVGFGSSEWIDNCVRTFIEPGDEAIIAIPTYGQFDFAVKKYGGKSVYVKLPPPDFKYNPNSVNSIIHAITERTKLVFIASPNNPTGHNVSPENLARIVDKNIIVVLDAAYEEFADEPLSKSNLVRHADNIVVLRTFSKAFSLAGLRVGYVLANSKLIAQLKKAAIVWNVSMPAYYAGIAALNDLDYMHKTVKMIKEGREYLYTELAKINGLRPFPSQANFILVDAWETGHTSTEIREALINQNILIKDASDIRGIDGMSYIRITVGKPRENRVLVHRLRHLLES